MAIQNKQYDKQYQWSKQNLDRIALTVPKGKRDVIKAEASKQGLSVNRFINNCIDKELSHTEQEVYKIK